MIHSANGPLFACCGQRPPRTAQMLSNSKWVELDKQMLPELSKSLVTGASYTVVLGNCHAPGCSAALTLLAAGRFLLI